jgi:hypothetical protein
MNPLSSLSPTQSIIIRFLCNLWRRNHDQVKVARFNATKAHDGNLATNRLLEMLDAELAAAESRRAAAFHELMNFIDEIGFDGAELVELLETEPRGY